jgi:tetratricopeptide (TPR) repeat protein
MQALRTVNIVWEQKFRGTYPVSRYALGDEGTVVLALPRPLEARAYDLTRLHPDGAMDVLASFSVETLLKLEVAASTDGLGMTADDIYLFRGGSKSRFLGEQRLLFVDAALSADGARLAVGFSDFAGASYALALGEMSGRVTWMRDVDMPLSALTLSRDGKRIALGAEAGTLWMVDAARRDVWQFEQEEPVRALACSADGAITVFGTAGGTVGLIDSEGARRWEARMPGEIVALALSGDGTLCAALVRTSEASTQIVCLVGEGQIGWEYETEKRLLGLSLSANGRYLATGARDGTVTVYEAVPGEAQGRLHAGSGESPARTAAEALAEAGDLGGAARTLRAALEADPADVALYQAFAAQQERWFQTCQEQAQACCAAGDFAGAVAALEPLLRADPYHVAAVTLRAAAGKERARQLLSEAREQAASGDAEAAERALLEAIAHDTHLLEARAELAALRARRAAEAAEEAERLLAEGNLEDGIAALERAHKLAPSPELAEKLARAQVAHEFMEGIAHYSAKRYHEAVFQFKKVLARDPGHNEARRYLDYAQTFAQDSATADLNDRFSRLE